MEASIDRLGFLGGGIGGNGPDWDEEPETTLVPRLDVLDSSVLCDLCELYDACRDVLGACGALLAVEDSSSSGSSSGVDRPNNDGENELTPDFGVEEAFGLLGLIDHLESALLNFLAGRRPFPSDDGDADDLTSEVASLGLTAVAAIEASLH